MAKKAAFRMFVVALSNIDISSNEEERHLFYKIFIIRLFTSFNHLSCCFCSSVASTRFLLQDEFNIQTTQCESCIISFMFLLQQLACICSLVACILGNSQLSEAAHVISCMSDMVYWTVCSCMQTQHKVELDKRDGNFVTMSVPPMQYMSRFDQPFPPQVLD
ncbi:uncharacterized protein LOC133904018 [Phragmites australis]|uniref:uncharacterized protein LOC133904018 n=1 Tax=Phragmites australis TaxID=29695 RepID=UPI002D774410|nr:uncharacterized protein LOC133904018 [Phragmites australis]